jgi:hypothetical protein
VPACSNCRKETELYYHGFPFCDDCSASGLIPDHVLPDAPKENSGEEARSKEDPPD